MTANTLRDAARALAGEIGAVPGLSGLYLGGSLGRGGGDGFSDLDFVGVAAEGDLKAVAADWAARLGEARDLVYLKNHGVLINAITRDWLRIDLVVETAERFAMRPEGEVLALHDPLGLAERLTGKAAALPGGPRIAARTEEFLRVLGLLRVGLGRDDVALCTEGFWHLRGHLKETMLDAARPDRRHGALSLKAILTDADYATLARFSSVAPEREALVSAHRDIAAAYLSRARALHDALGVAWPEDFEDATRDALIGAFGPAIDWRAA